ncbi:MAG: homocysteine S-methyltransferase family protein [Gammaproteobacteria bacterium]|nr:homocysteine S-methyltransferase family protein [Gammaproteobacteria bacterium]
MAHEVVLLDGGMGTELRARGVEVPDHITSIWSAKALVADRAAVVAVHRDYIDAGADVITINNYAVTPPLLAREGMEGDFEALTLKAVELAERARDASQRPVRIAGSLPPLETSYRPDLVRDDVEIGAVYERMAELLATRVDILLCETLSCAREAVAAARAATAFDREVWLSWTLQGNLPDRLPSGETVEEAFDAASGLPVDGYLVNCCGANFVTGAMEILRKLTDKPIGGYANSANVIPAVEGEASLAPEGVERERLDVDAYGETVKEWMNRGATIVGGCCGTRPSHIARLRQLIDSG